MDTNQHIEANSISPQTAANIVTDWKVAQIGYLLSVFVVPCFICLIVPRIEGVEKLLMPPLTEEMLFTTIPNCAATIFAIVVIAYVIANIYLVVRKILKITSSAPYQVTQGTYVRHKVRAKRNKYGHTKCRLVVKFEDEHGRKHRAFSPLSNRPLLQEMNKGDSVTIVSVRGFLGMRKYTVFISQYFREQNPNN